VIVDVPEMQGRAPLQAVISGTNKVVFTGPNVQVYDLARDPGEKTPVSGDSSEDATARARRALARIQGVTAKPCQQASPSPAERDDS
jgi:hypothetical protein